MSKIEKIWLEEARRYDAIDFTDEFKAAFDKSVADINGCSNDEKGLKNIEKVKDDYEKRLEDIRQDFEAKCTDISNAGTVATSGIENLNFAMSTSQFNKYKSQTEEWSKQIFESSENCYMRNNTLYCNCINDLNKLYSEKVEKIHDSIVAAMKEAKRKAYLAKLAHIREAVVGCWKDSGGKTKLLFNHDGTFSFDYYAEAWSLVIGPDKIYADKAGIVKVASGRISEPEKVRRFSGTYYFEEDVIVLNVTSAVYKNTPEIKPGDKIKSKIYLSDSENSLWFDKANYKRAW
ncbi:hypothetical protein [uncultured Treponema sp.]|uniref:hypothetical protein n=1 Tax=uncultured Treponema sp. TaxID=162155 RepID=UPI0025E50582|nr:hypothetical protein [uncultured Treponema sp.]